jgi:hypothetical protein
LKRRIDYLAVERCSERRHELIDGVIGAMAGGSDERNAIAGRFAMLFGVRLRDECRAYTPDQRFWIAAGARRRCADGSIICGKPVHPPHDDQATTNPVVALDVLSPSSEGDEDGTSGAIANRSSRCRPTSSLTRTGGRSRRPWQPAHRRGDLRPRPEFRPAGSGEPDLGGRDLRHHPRH